MPADLSDLRNRVAEATAPDREIDVALARAFNPEFVKMLEENAADAARAAWATGTAGVSAVDMQRSTFRAISDYTSSIDAAVALVESVLPGGVWLRKSPLTMTVVRPLTPEQDERKEWAQHFDARGANPALALVAALLAALDQGTGR